MSSLYSNQSDQNPTNLNRLDSSKIRLPKLHQAAKSGNVMKIDKELRKSPADTVDAIGRTAIHIACLHNKVTSSFFPLKCQSEPSLVALVQFSNRVISSINS